MQGNDLLATTLKDVIIKSDEFNMKKKIRAFESGAVRDQDLDKENYVECFSFRAWRRFAQYMKTQEKKYPPDNWRKGIPVKEYEKSLMRHLQKYFTNKYEGGKSELEIDHLAAAYFNLQGLMHQQEVEQEDYIIKHKIKTI